MIRLFRDGDYDYLPPLRPEAQTQDVTETVLRILRAVERDGDDALRAFARFNFAALETTGFDKLYDDALKSNSGNYKLEVSRGELEDALNSLDENFRRILTRAHDNIAKFHRCQKRDGFICDGTPGVIMGQRVIPLDRVGLYVPGGTAPYPSTVLMDAIPARIAGVGEVFIASPPGKDGKIPTDILAAAALAGVDRVFAMGGAQAVAAFAYGTASVPRVNKITGPGNIYVQTAKRMVFGRVGIDMFAGPSDILVIADDTAIPEYVAADMLSQAEHDTLSQAVLITVSETLAARVSAELEVQLQRLERRDIAARAIADNSAIILTDSLENAAELSNRIAPEHLELCVAEPFSLLPSIRHAGSVFLGNNTPEALGDYMAGPNHTLPTEGAARFSSPLSVDDFCKRSSFLSFSGDAFRACSDDVAAFARREGLGAHARSADIRRETT